MNFIHWKQHIHRPTASLEAYWMLLDCGQPGSGVDPHFRDGRKGARVRVRAPATRWLNSDGGREPGYPGPPPRTGRAAFPHPAPTSDSDGKTLRPSVRAPASVTRFPG